MRYFPQIAMPLAAGAALVMALAGSMSEAQVRSEPAGVRIAQAQAPAAAAAAPPFRTFKDCSECPEMVELPAGRFTMGQADGDSDERPAHEVTIGRPFAIGKFEVTFDEWEACAADGGCAKNKKPDDEEWGRGRRPVINISWEDAKEYVAWLSRKTGKFYRLPSEAEWEYAARAGTTTKYAFGDTINKDQARFSDGRFGKSGDGKTAEVGSYPPNAWGLYDMHGNAWEYTEDCYQLSYRGAPSNGSARLTSICPYRTLRGGSWDYLPQDLRSAVRYKLKPKYRMDETGLRVVRSMD